MTAAVIALAAVAAALTAGLLATGWRLYAALQAAEPERAKTAAAVLERDSWRIRAAELAATVTTLTADLATARADLAACTAKEADHAADDVRHAADPLDALNRVLARPLVPADDPAAAGGDGGTALAMQPAAAVDGAAGAGG